MPKMILIPLAAALIGGGAFAMAGPTDVAGYTAKEQQRLDKLLAKRTAGKPIDCVNTRDLGGNEGFGDNLIVFKGRTNAQTLYVNRPAGGCARFTASSAISFSIPSTRLCRGDIVHVFDPVSKIPQGSCGLADFVPYTRN